MVFGIIFTIFHFQKHFFSPLSNSCFSILSKTIKHKIIQSIMIYMSSGKGGGMDFCYVTSGGGSRFLLHSITRQGRGGRSKFRQKVGYVTVECSHTSKLFLIWCLTANNFSNSQFIQHNPQCIYRFEY